MKLHVRYRRLESTPELDRLVARRIHFALSRFAHAIRAVHVTLADINGPRGGIDKAVRVRILGPRLGSIVVEGTAVDVPEAVDGAIGRAARSTARALDRRRLIAALS